MVDTDENGNVDKDEVNAFFEAADTNGDGNLDEEEVIKVLADRLGNMASGVVARQMIRYGIHLRALYDTFAFVLLFPCICGIYNGR